MTPPPLTPARVRDAWRRRRWLAIAVAATVVAGFAAAVRSLPNLYRAAATVVVEREVSEEFVKPSVTSQLEARIQTIHQIVTSREHLATLIREMNLYERQRRVTPMAEVVDAMRADIALQLRGVEQTDGSAATIAFTVRYRGRDPKVVADVVNRLVDDYIAENMRSRERQAGETAAFLLQQLNDQKRQVDQLERQARTFAMTHTEELPQQRDAHLAALTRLHGELSILGERQLRLVDRRERLEQENALGSLIVPPPDTTSPRARLVALRAQRASLRRTFSDEYPDIKRMNSEIAALERDVAAETDTSGAPDIDPVASRRQSLKEIDTELGSLRQQEATVRTRIAYYEKLVSGVPRRQIDMDQIANTQTLAKQRYQELLAQYEDARLASTLEQGQGVEQFRVLDAAVPPRFAVAPNRPLLALIGLMGALALAMIAVVIAEKLDTSFHSPDDLRALVQGPAIVPLRRVTTRRARRIAWLRGALATIGVLAAIAVAAAAGQYLATGNERIVRVTSRGTV